MAISYVFKIEAFAKLNYIASNMLIATKIKSHSELPQCYISIYEDPCLLLDQAYQHYSVQQCMSDIYPFHANTQKSGKNHIDIHILLQAKHILQLQW